MARVLYIEPEEEITDLVERIRATDGERELVFVVPPRARVLQSGLHLRMLQQYSRSFVKDSSIVSGDPRVQALARQAGFATYASVAAYERGIEAERPSADGDSGPPAAPSWVPVEPPAAPDAPLSESTERWIGAVAAEPQGREPRATRTAVAAPPAQPRPQGVRRLRLYIGAGALFLLGLLLLFLVAPSAKVVIRIQADPVSVNDLVIQGTVDPVAAQGPDKVLTVKAAADEAATFVATPTGQKPLPATPASSSVVFTNDFSGEFCLPLSKGEVIAESAGVKWQVAAQPTPDCFFSGGNGQSQGGIKVPSGQGGHFGPPSQAVSVIAQTAGAATNVAAGAINIVEPTVNGCNKANYPPGQAPPCAPADWAVSNAAAATGGADAKTVTVVQDADLQSFNAQRDQLIASGTEKAKQAMLAQAPGKTFAIDRTNNGAAFATDVSPALPNAGDQYQPTTITVTVHGKGVFYDPKDVRAIVLDDLTTKAKAKNGQLAQGAIVKDPVIVQADPGGGVVIQATGSGFSQPTVDVDKLRDSFAGQGRDSVRRLVRERFPNSLVGDPQISQSIPFFNLPFFASRIDVQVCIDGGGQTCG